MDSNKIESSEANINKNGVVLMMNPSEEESSISIRDLLYAILKKIGIILVVALLLSVVLFAYKFFKKTQSSNVLDTSIRLSGETDVQFQTRVQNVDRAKDIVQAISRVNGQIENQRKYITDSVFMQINAENEYESTVQVVIKLKDSDSTGSDSALISAYNLDIEAGDYLNDYAFETGIKADYIKELMTFTFSPYDSNVTALDNEVNRTISMYVRIKGPSQEFIDRVSDIVVEEFNRKYDELNKSVVPHTMNVIGVQKNVKVDSVTRDSQVNQTARLETLQKQVVSYYDSLDVVAKNLGLSGKDELLSHFNDIESGISVVSSGEVSAKSKIKPSLKFAVIGFAAGFVFVTVVIILAYVFAKKVATQAQFFSVFTDVKKIGVMKPSAKRSKLVTCLDIKTDDDTKMSAENNKKLILANYDNLTRDLKKVLITGTGDKKAMGDAVKSIGIKGDFKPDIFSNPDILKDISGYDGVVLLEQRKVSLYKNVANEISLINNSGVDIIGAIII
ncbi:MAG: hypothetical protein IJL19_05500 [Clostridiales bacterium]|nr:hypothetical protein [Clostridiales bacterium]